MATYIERPQEFECRQFEGPANAKEVADWLLQGWSKITALIVPQVDPFGGQRVKTFLRVVLKLNSQLGETTVEIPEGRWLVFDCGSQRWDLLEDSEFQQNFVLKS